MTSFTFTEGGNTKPFETFIETEMDRGLKYFERELTKIRTGRAHTSMVEDLKIACYGSTMSLRELAALSAPEPQLIVIQPWDKSIINDIEKAITQSELGVSPANDGSLIRIQLPRLSKERRDELTKILSKKLEECKVTVRNIRKDVHNLIRDAEKNKKISEDYSKRLQDVLQKSTDKLCEVADKLAVKKTAELQDQ